MASIREEAREPRPSNRDGEATSPFEREQTPLRACQGAYVLAAGAAGTAEVKLVGGVEVLAGELAGEREIHTVGRVELL